VTRKSSLNLLKSLFENGNLKSPFMTHLLSKTLSQIVNEKHQAASVFEQHNLDYCCKGKRTLQKACDENDVPAHLVVKALENIYSAKANELDFNCIKLYQLADYIVYTHHNYVKKEVPRILSWLENVSAKHGSRHNELYKISELFVDISNEMYHHMEREETILFPRIKLLEQRSFELIPFDHPKPGYLQSHIINLEHEHIDAGKVMAEIKKLTNNYTIPESSCTTFQLLYTSLKAFEVDLHHHVHLENSILFPKALVMGKEIRALSFL
jgi:regulator of cell morphogenesis and NO signaling